MIHQLEAKKTQKKQPIICHLSCSSGIVLWCPFRTIKSWLINIIEMLMGAMQIAKLSNYKLVNTQSKTLIKDKVPQVKHEKIKQKVVWSSSFITDCIFHIHLYLKRACVERCTIHRCYHIHGCTEEDWHVCLCRVQPIISRSMPVLPCGLSNTNTFSNSIWRIFPLFPFTL